MFSGRRICYLSVILILLFTFAAGCGGGAGAKVTKQLELAVKYLSENKFEEAILAYQEVIKIDPQNVQAYKGLSVTYYLLGKTDQAEQGLQDGTFTIVL
ncbi:Tfp pilus assembly protein PilF [Desulfofundulus luciae]|uniref:Tfp pilus assembly protein PilF n=1 Tax=Desulfofundulus luciae TaxID=74702 RepID=A0ABU0AYQ7_9FIRM|nr:Tfp pilus assembly protein PilF [Desulfofundulus luciae]